MLFNPGVRQAPSPAQSYRNQSPGVSLPQTPVNLSSPFSQKREIRPAVQQARVGIGDDMTRQVAEWDAQMDGLDKQQEKLVNEQWKLLRNQIGALMGVISDMKAELVVCKEQSSTKHIEESLEKLFSKQGEHSSFAERIQYLEDFIGESADKHKTMLGQHEDHKTTMETRLEYIEGLIGDSADKHASELKSALDKMKDLHTAIASCAKAEHHSSIETRVEYLESFLGESADKHEKDLAEHKDGFTEHKESMETRLEFIESLIGDSADKHWKEIDSSKKKLGSVELAVQACAKQEHISSLEQRMEYVEKIIGESADNHKTTKDTVEGRLDGIERKLREFGTSLDGKGHKSDIEKLEATICAGIDKRLTAIEEKHLQDFLKRLNTYETNHMKEFTDMKQRLSDIDKLLAETAKIEHYIGMDRKHEGLKESLASDSQATKAKLAELQAKVCASEGTLDAIQRKLTDGHDGLGRKLSTIEAATSRYKAMFDEFDGALRVERSNRETGDGKADERLSRLEGMVQGSLGSCVKDMDVTKGRLSDALGKLEAQRANLENFKTTVDVRLGHVDASMAESIQGIDLVRELEQRFLHLQVDQQRARDLLESSLEEKIKLEHSAVHSQASQIKEQWDREVKARQAYQENYQELLGQERSARESQEMVLDKRIETFERSLYAEIQRLWQEVGKEPPAIIQQYVTSPRVSQVRISPPQTTQYRVAAQPIVTNIAAGNVSGMTSVSVPSSVTVPAAINSPPVNPMVTRQYSTGTMTFKSG